MDITKNCKYIARGRALIRACGSRGECVGAGIHHALADNVGNQGRTRHDDGRNLRDAALLML